MNSKLIRTIFLALAFGFLVLWVLEFRRAGLFESYWLLLLCIICFLLFQFTRLKAAALAKGAGQPEAVSKKSGAASAGAASAGSAVGSRQSAFHSKPGKKPKK
ncbi:hypothetical protein LZD49_08240 [Dyadobacter sp. CY261]|uniref:hypothetical protein n=1 Tax=Dyadobacter sp. CY261 TaxID=2907203 RepID=UPI001F487034|nr:hypothetical protein [Dyadobacter sp. CY261]MCF0070459.1 hypothetical protein [Dyadobacter sp. CY261]